MQIAIIRRFEGVDLEGFGEAFKHIGPWIKPYLELAVDVVFRRFGLRHREIDEAAEMMSVPLDWYQPLSEPVFGPPAIQHQCVFMPLT